MRRDFLMVYRNLVVRQVNNAWFVVSATLRERFANSAQIKDAHSLLRTYSPIKVSVVDY
jgi:hypothetical protein